MRADFSGLCLAQEGKGLDSIKQLRKAAAWTAATQISWYDLANVLREPATWRNRFRATNER